MLKLSNYPYSQKYINFYLKFSKRMVSTTNYQYDLFVIGGGSGGLSASKEAANLGVKVGLADYVKPTPIGTKWGIGGTCVNVGCIPKKMMHFAGGLFENLEEYPNVGYEGTIQKNHNWQNMVANVQTYIKKLNFGYRSELRSKKVVYYNKLAKLLDEHTIELTDSKGNKENVTADKILVAVGGRPNYGGIPGAVENCITSDDIFSLKQAPGKTLVVGASYIALECGGFLHAMGYDTSIMVRSILLRGFDQGISNKIGAYMEKHGMKFIKESIPINFSKSENGKILVQYKDTQDKIYQDEYDTCLMAIGRSPDTKNLGLENVGVKLASNGKIIVDESEQSNLKSIYAIGDCAQNRPELTPPAIMAGKLLSKRLFGESTQNMDYVNIATTVFTPLEYGCVGYSEEEAYKKFGKENISAYHSEFVPLEWNFNLERGDTCYVKVLVNKSDNNRVVGFHILSPNAGEITQGIGVAIKCGLTKDQLDSTVGIHPTIAEV
jgi:thioredoxin/glutathione reductase (selenoprotein)